MIYVDFQMYYYNYECATHIFYTSLRNFMTILFKYMLLRFVLITQSRLQRAET
jgi:hypothetical protein